MLNDQKVLTAISLDEEKAVHDDREYLQHTTLGWNVGCKWKVGSTSWEILSDVKELHPLQVIKYAISMDVDHKPRFNWWVLHMLKKHDLFLP